MTAGQDDGEDSGRRRRHVGRQNPAGRMVSGLFVALGFVALGLLRPQDSWAFLVAIVAGALPFARGLRDFIGERASRPSLPRESTAEREAALERSILRIAQDREGVVTPAAVALDSGLGLDEAERALQGLVARNHATMEVRDDGCIEYLFAEFRHLT